MMRYMYLLVWYYTSYHTSYHTSDRFDERITGETLSHVLIVFNMF